MQSAIRIGIPAALAAAVALGLAVGVMAHGDTETVGYTIVAGFMVEPAYEGLPNGVDVRVTRGAGKTDRHSSLPMPDKGSVGMGVDVEAHGAFFASSGLNHGDAFSYEPGRDLEGMTIPYHNHLDHTVTGAVTVSRDRGEPGPVEIAIHDGMYMPANVTVQPGARIVWTNQSSGLQAVTSGVMPAMDFRPGAMPHTQPAAMPAPESQPGAMPPHTQPEAAMSMSDGTPVEGLAGTLQVEIIHPATGESRTLKLRAVPGKPGHYTADIIPTAQGVYEMRVFGTIDGDDVDETFASQGAGGGFSDVLPAGELHFPVRLPEAREIEGAARGALETAQQAQDTAIAARDNSSNALAIAGIVLGALGTAAGIGGLTIAMRKR